MSDHSDAVYRCGENAVFAVKAVDASTGAAATGGTIRVRLDNFGDAVVAAERTVDFAKDGCEFSLAGTLGEPGFLRLRALPERGTKLAANAGQGEFNWAVAFDPKGIRPGAPCPDDFDAFWAEAIAKYDREVPEDVTLELYPPQCGYAAYNVCPSRDKRIHHGIGQGHAVSGETYGKLAKWRNGK